MKLIQNTYLFILIIFSFTSCSSNWYTFQSNNARTGFIDRPAIDTPKIIWKTNIGIQGYLNNSIVTSRKVFVGSSGSEHNTSDSMDGIYCLDKTNGNVIWHYQTQKDACGVAYSKNNIYATGDDGYLRCLNASNGIQKWSIKREGELYSQPLIINNSVIIGDASGTILIVNQQNGKVIYEKKVANSNIRGGLSSDGTYIYATFVEGKIICLDLDGNTIWEVQGEFHGEHGKDFDGIYGAPTITDNQLIVPFIRSTYYDTPAIYSFNKINGKLIWKATDNSDNALHGNIRSSVAVNNDYVYFGSPYSNSLLALRLKDGVLDWEIGAGESTHPHWPSPVIANNILYLARHDGGLNAFDLEKKECIWQLFLGNHNNIKLLEKNYGQHDKKYASRKGFPIPSIYATPSLDKHGNIYIGSGEGWFYAIENKKIAPKKNPN